MKRTLALACAAAATISLALAATASAITATQLTIDRKAPLSGTTAVVSGTYACTGESTSGNGLFHVTVSTTSGALVTQDAASLPCTGQSERYALIVQGIPAKGFYLVHVDLLDHDLGLTEGTLSADRKVRISGQRGRCRLHPSERNP